MILVRTTSILLLCCAAAAGGAIRAQSGSSIETPSGVREAYAEARGRVVGVSFTVRPMEAEPGVEGPKSDGVLCGVIVDAAGVLVTASDIFPEPGGDPRNTLAPTEFRIHFGGDRTVPAEAIGIDRNLNLAFLKFDPAAAPDIRPAIFRGKPDLRVGDPVAIIGVLGRKYGFAPAVFRATVNAVIEKPVTLFSVDAIIQDLTVGGLVLRRDGSAAGIVTKDVITEDLDSAKAPGNFLAIIANMGQPQIRKPGYAMILPYGEFEKSVASPPPLDLVTEIKRSWIGIVMQALDDDLRDYWGLSVPGGIIVGSVVDGSPAQAGGLMPGDIITGFAGEPVRINQDSQLPDFRRRVERMGVGEQVPLEVYRGGQRREISITLRDAPKTASLAEDYEDEEFGMTVREITIDVQQALNLDPGSEGVVVERTEEAGWADVSGLFPQDLIVSINGKKVRTVAEFRTSLAGIKSRQESEAIFFVMRPPDTLFVRVKTDYGSRGLDDASGG